MNRLHFTRLLVLLPRVFFVTWLYSTQAFASLPIEAVRACLLPDNRLLTQSVRQNIAKCLDWESHPEHGRCEGYYRPSQTVPLSDPKMIELEANQVTLRGEGQSVFQGTVGLRKESMYLEANTAYVYRDPKTQSITLVTLLGGVRLTDSDYFILADKIDYQPQKQSFQVYDVLYRMNTQHHAAELPAWGRATEIQKDASNTLFLKKATYTHCAPSDNAWEVQAKSLSLYQDEALGVAKNATLKIKNIPVLYTPYLTFPLSKKRKSGFLMPTIGSTTVGGFDMSVPYYLNLAPNYDATFVPHLYTKRGLMYGGLFRYLTQRSTGYFQGGILPHDRAYSLFLNQNAIQYPDLARQSTDRWDMHLVHAASFFDSAVNLRIDARQLSDSYYFQDFSTNLGTVTERQVLRQGLLEYHNDNWLFRGKLQSYQTLHPINETPVQDIYERLPQLIARGEYDELPFHGQFKLDGEYDFFRWPGDTVMMPEGSRYHLNPVFSLNEANTWGYFTPSVQWVGNAYNLTDRRLEQGQLQQNLSVPRFSVDSGVTFERKTNYFKRPFLQTLEPRLYYLNVPYQNQTQIPVFDSAYMIFTAEQVFRDNRFSGFDRIGDANQLGYGLTTRFISDDTGEERASVIFGQLRYFSDRKVGLCFSPTGVCQDNPLTLGQLSPVEAWSPAAVHGVYHFNRLWSLVGDYAFDPATQTTNNTQVAFGYRGENNRLLNLGYTYLVNGDVTNVATAKNADNSLNQVSFSYAWPFTERWSSLGAYSYNLSKQYQMMTLFGVQYENCCWAARLIAGKTFRDLDQLAYPRYTNSVFLQVLLKGLGSVGNSDPTSVLRTFLPNYRDSFKN